MTCQQHFQKLCFIDCSMEVIQNVTTVTTYRGNVLSLYQFWIFFMIVLTLWISLTVGTTLQNPICLDLLGETHNNLQIICDCTICFYF